MSDRNKKTLFDIDREIYFHRKYLQWLEALRRGLLSWVEPSSPTKRKKVPPDTKKNDNH